MIKMTFRSKLVCTILLLTSLATSHIDAQKTEAEIWADSVFQTLNQNEKIAQFFMVAAHPKSADTEKHIKALIEKYSLGGIIFMNGEVSHQLSQGNAYQKAAKVPIMYAIDGEWGLGMRYKNTISYPYQMGLGALQNDSLIYEMGLEIGRQMNRIGIHVNFAPVVDVNNNPKNPVISYRSFGENKKLVTSKGIAYMKGLQDAGIMAVAKHFPGHGDTDVDSHKGLPVISYDRARLDSLELYPFKKIFDAGIGGVMIAHMSVLSLDDTPDLPSTLSKPIVTDLLQDQMGFEGLIFTDAMNMKGVAASSPPGIVDLQAFMAGNDIMEFSEDVPRAIKEIKKALKKGMISEEELNERCKKVLRAKYWMGLHRNQIKNTENVFTDLNTEKALLLNKKMITESLTVLRNENQTLPWAKPKELKVAKVIIGESRSKGWDAVFGGKVQGESYTISPTASADEVKALNQKLEEYNRIILGVFQPEKRPYADYEISEPVVNLINLLAQKHDIIIAYLGNAYTLDKFESIHDADGLILAYQNTAETHQAVADLILGKSEANGKLPITVNSHFRYDDGLTISAPPKLGMSRFDQYLPKLQGKTVGLVVNHTSVANGVHLVDTLLNLQVKIQKIFTPEHGFRGTADAGEHVKDGIDPKTNLPLVSLYGSSRKPTKEMLAGLDAVIFDIQDVGVRFYTYISTMHYMMEACAENDVEFIVLDRPNPNGDYVDGPVLNMQYQSFVGMHPIPVVHGLTIGELARMINGEGWLKNGLNCNLTVVPMMDYSHSQRYSLPVAPSPNLPNDLAVRLYPSLCLFEPTNVSIGRGTYEPFQIIGITNKKIGDYTFKPKSIDGMSKSPKHLDNECFGTDLRKLQHAPTFTLSYLIDYYRAFANEGDFYTNKKVFDKLAGGDLLSKQLKDGLTEEQIRQSWQPRLQEYLESREKYLLYE